MTRPRSLAPMVFMLFAVVGLSGAVESAGLHSVYFDYGSSALSAESQKTLERHAAWLKDHAEVLLEVQGWDDFYVGKGDGRLSVKRAEAVKEFLSKKGVELDRMTIKDRGAAPWDPTRKSDPRTFRRVDFLVIGKRSPTRSTPEASEPMVESAAPASSTAPPVGAVEPVPTESAPVREPAKTEIPVKAEPTAAPEQARPAPPVEPPVKKETPPAAVPPKEAKSVASAPETKPVPPSAEPEKVVVAAPAKEEKSPPVATAPEPASAAAPPRGTSAAAVPEPEPPREEKIEQAWMKWKPSNVGPKPRWGHGMVFDASSGRVVLFGGTNGKLVFGDLWEFDLKSTRWSPVQPGGGDPGPLAYHSAVYDSQAKRMIIFGGSSNLRDTTDSVWSLSLKKGAESWVKIEFPVSPGPRAAQSTAYDSRSHRMVIFGGCAKNLKACLYSNDLWELDLKVGAETWSPLSGVNSPPGERESAMAFTQADGNLVVIGGFNAKGYLRDAWIYDRKKKVWSPMETPLSARCCASYHEAAKGSVLFGGNDRRAFFQDTWWSNGKEFKEIREPSMPQARAFSRLVPTGEPNMYFLFGGQSPSGAMGDFWVLKLK
ncbi:MAG: OmpA family protein [Nitrospirae bacterium]|nr:OmpA family protein [Nitrospirota bacterium]